MNTQTEIDSHTWFHELHGFVNELEFFNRDHAVFGVESRGFYFRGEAAIKNEPHAFSRPVGGEDDDLGRRTRAEFFWGIEQREPVPEVEIGRHAALQRDRAVVDRARKT